jgi:hypothetical protein
MSIFAKFAVAGFSLCVAWTAAPGATPAAKAQDAAYMSCDQLWYARNAIYARNGYCFQTARARAVFGAGCFPPFGQLNGWEQNRVMELQSWERRRGC